MFKAIQAFNIAPSWEQDPEAIQAALEAQRFIECGASQERSIGWAEPRGEKHAPLLESVGGHWILKMMFETKFLPSSVVKEATEKRAEAIEASTGHKPGKKEKKELMEEVRNELLSKAFTKKSAALIWIDPTTKRLVIEAGAGSRSDDIISLLVESLQGFSVKPSTTKQTPAVSMSQWLLDASHLPSNFTADRDCMLKASDESKASIRYAKHALDIEEIQAHIRDGKIPTQLAMTWEDRVSFMLTENGMLKKIEFLDIVFDKTSVENDSGFDAAIAIVTGELTKLIPELLDAMGGEEVV